MTGHGITGLGIICAILFHAIPPAKDRFVEGVLLFLLLNAFICGVVGMFVK